MLNNTFATTFRHLPNISIKNVDLKCFSTLLQYAISEPTTKNVGPTFGKIKAKRNGCYTNFMVRVFHYFQNEYNT